MVNTEDLYDLYPAGTMNVEQYYEYRDKYCASGERAEKNRPPRSVLINTDSKLEISAIINKAKGVYGNPSTFESLESSENTIDKEILNMLSKEGDPYVEEKLDLTKTKATCKHDGKVRVAGLKGDVYLDDSFFELKLNESQKKIVSPRGPKSSKNPEYRTSSKKSELLIQNNSEDEIYQRAINRYAKPTIGVEGQHYLPTVKTTFTLNSYLDATYKQQRQSKSKKASCYNRCY